MSYLILVGPIILALYVIAYLRKATVDSAVLTGRTIVIESEHAPADAYQRLATGVGKFELEDSDESRCIVLGLVAPTGADTPAL